MPVGTSDGKYFENEWEATISQFSDLSSPSTAQEMPPTATEKPAGALKSNLATTLPDTPGEALDDQSRPKHKDENFLSLFKETWPAKIVEGFANAFTLPGKVWDGKVDLNTKEGVDQVTEMAINLGMGGMATTGFKPGVGMFGGRMSKEAVQAATNLEKAGLPADKVKYYTGLERGAEGMWRKEISDVDAKVTPLGKSITASDLETTHYQKLGDILEHNPLYRDYPELKDLKVQVTPAEFMGTNTGMYFTKGSTSPDPVLIIKKGMSEEETIKTILHETQHAIQHKEGFSFSPASNELTDQVRGSIIRKEYSKSLEDIADYIDKGQVKEARAIASALLENSEITAYRSAAHEAEAFNVENRMHMTPEQIRKSLGKETEDVPRARQIVGEDKAGSAYRPEVKPQDLPPGYFDKVPQETRLSSTGISHPGYRFEVYDPKTDKVVRTDIQTKSGASKTKDNADNKYGGYKYRVRMVKAKEITPEEETFLSQHGIDIPN